MAKKLAPKLETIAFRAWAYCETHGWDRTVADLAQALDLRERQVQNVVNFKRWQNRFRTKATRQNLSHSGRSVVDIGGIEI